MDIRKLRIVSGCAALVVAGMGIHHQARGQIAITGTIDPAFGSPLSYAQVPSSGYGQVNVPGGVGSGNTVGFSDSSAIDATYATIRADSQGVPTLYMFYAGNIFSGNYYAGGGTSGGQSQPEDMLDVWLQSGTGGVNNLTSFNPGGGAMGNGFSKFKHITNNKNPLTFDSTFSPNYWMNVLDIGGTSTVLDGGPGDTHYADFAVYGSFANLNGPAGQGTVVNQNKGYPGNNYLSTSFNNGAGSPNGFAWTLDNSNTVGVTGTTVPSQQVLRSVSTGIELSIPLASITEAGQSLTAGSPIEIGA